MTVLTAQLDDPTGYGRIVRGADGAVDAIVEQKDATSAERAIREINSGIYAFDVAALRDGLARLTTDNAQGELYLTDVLGIARADGKRVGALATDDTVQTEGVNDRVQLAGLRRELNRRTVEAWMRAGVTVDRPGHDLDRRRRHARAGRRDRSPNTQLRGTHRGRTGTPTVGPNCHAGRHRGRVGRQRHADTTSYGADIGPEATVGPLHVPAAGHPAGPERQGRRVRRDEERHGRRRREGAAPVLRRRCDDRRGVEHRRRQRSSSTTTASTSTTPRSATHVRGRQRHDAGGAGRDRRTAPTPRRAR